jgi:hypothetical protein
VVTKPFTTDQLQPVVERLLSAAREADPQEATASKQR